MHKLLKISFIAILFSVTITASLVSADTVVFINGDVLAGRVKEVTGGKMLFDSNMIGTVSIPLEKITTFSTDKPFALQLNDGTTIISRIEAASPSTIAVPDPNEPSKVDIDMIFTMDPEQFPDPRWTGAFSLGFTSAHGNSRIDSARLSFNASKRTLQDRTSLSADYGRSEDKAGEHKTVTQDWFKSQGKYDWFFRPKDYIYGEGRFETNRIADLSRRIVAGSGVGRQLAESRRFSLAIEAGAASIYDTYSGGNADSDIASQLGCDMSIALNSRLSFSNKTQYNPAFKDFSDYILSNTAELRASLTERIFTNFKIIFDYDSVPAETRTSTDMKYMLGIGSKF